MFVYDIVSYFYWIRKLKCYGDGIRRVGILFESIVIGFFESE